MKQKAKPAIRWVITVLGSLVGLYMLAVSGMSGLPHGDSSPAWYLDWFSLIGTTLVGISFLAGSIAALRRPKVGGIIFLAFLPIAAFCLAYPNAGFLVWHDGGGWFETPIPSKAIGLAALFFLPFAAALVTLRNRKRAATMFAITALPATFIFIRSHWTAALLPRLVGYSVPFLLFGLFWLWTFNLGWPTLLRPRQLGATRRIRELALIVAAVLVLDVAVTFALSAFFSSLSSPDCGEAPPLTRPVQPAQAGSAVFTARAVLVGSSIDGLLPTHQWIRSSHMGEWAIGVVEERFWGLPSWQPRFVLMTDFIYWKGQTYLIAGTQGQGFLTRFLPIVGAGSFCSRSRPLADDVIDFRLLHEPPPVGGTRLIGYVKAPGPFVPIDARPIQPTFDSGAKIIVTGGNGTREITTDQAGIYQLDGLPPGDYTLRLDVPYGQAAGDFGDGSTANIRLKNSEVIEHDFNLLWNGRINGHVTDDSGKPQRAWIELQTSDGSRLPGYVRFFLKTSPDGSYEIDKVPPGRYLLIVNPDGPSDESPYALQYYPATFHTQNAQALEVGPGQELPDINFTVLSLVKRTIQVRVMWQDRKPAKNAWVYVAYPHTKAFDSLANTTDFQKTNENGDVELDVFGDSHIRVFAEMFLESGTVRDSLRYSLPVELDTSSLPSTLALVLSTSTLGTPSRR